MNKEKHPNRVKCPKCGRVGTKQSRMIKCGKSDCKKCPHGPYFYVTHRVGNKIVQCYIGKTWPSEKTETGCSL